MPAELAGFLAEQGRRDVAIEVLPAADSGEDVALQLAGLLVEAGRYHDAIVQYRWCDPDEAATQIDGHPGGVALLAWWRQACASPGTAIHADLLDDIQARLSAQQAHAQQAHAQPRDQR